MNKEILYQTNVNSFLSSLRKVENKVFTDMGKYSQLVIDFVQNTESLFNRNGACDPVIRGDELGAIQYRINSVLEIINPERKDDIILLNELYSVLKYWEPEFKINNNETLSKN